MIAIIDYDAVFASKMPYFSGFSHMIQQKY